MRRYLPTLTDLQSAPQVHEARRRLGGRGSSEPGAGLLVEVVRQSRSDPGVVLFVSGNELDVWMGQGRVERIPRDRVRPLVAPAHQDLVAIAGDVHVFVHLLEGGRVRYLDQGRMSLGTLVEKCRYGALVLRDDQQIMAIGFRKLFPVPEQASPC
jgi:hypothetical protein